MTYTFHFFPFFLIFAVFCFEHRAHRDKKHAGTGKSSHKKVMIEETDIRFVIIRSQRK